MDYGPIVFTISKTDGSNVELVFYKIATEDPRGESENIFNLQDNKLFKTMSDISEVLNNKGYAVLFKVDLIWTLRSKRTDRRNL